jgi:hypothetical protein
LFYTFIAGDNFMRKKLLSLVLSICLIMPCALFLAACGNNPPEDPAHTHNWSTTWSKNSTEHWLTCDGCNEKKDKANHDGDTCSVCGYIKSNNGNTNDSQDNNNDNNNQDNKNDDNNNQDDGLPVVANVRDLEIVTLRTNRNGFATLVKLPDGKNMLIDSGADDPTSELEVDDMLLSANITTLDYFVTTTASAGRTGAADLVFEYYQVNNFYKPEISSNITPTEAYLTAIEKAELEPNCIITIIGESNCDISYTFKDNSNNRYTYEIDFMIPIAAANATNTSDNSVVVSIEYQDKVVLITNEATNENIDAYCTKYGTQNDVDVLIVSHIPSEQYAITASANRGTDFLAKINFEASDRVVIVPLASQTAVNLLESNFISICGVSNMHSLSTDRRLTTAVTKITSNGVVSVTSR